MSLEFNHASDSFPNTILIDGAWGTGKSLVAPIVSSFSNVGPFRIDQTLDVLSVFYTHGKISKDAFEFLIQNKLIENHYHNAIGREINLRNSDDSSVQRQIGWIEVLRRIYSKKPELEWSRLQGQVYSQVTHLLAPCYSQLLASFAGKIKIVNIQRNPAALLPGWQSYLSRFDRSREFTVSSRVNGTKVPFFAFNWLDEWLKSSNLERAVLAISRLAQAEWNTLDQIKTDLNAGQYLRVVHFKAIVDNLAESTDSLASFLGQSTTLRTQKIILDINSAKYSKGFRFEDSDSSLSLCLSNLQNNVGSNVYREFRDCIDQYLSRELESYNF